MKFKKFADELRNKLLLLGLKEKDLRPFDISFDINYCYGNLPIITIHYDNEYISSLVLEEIDFFQSNISKEYYEDLTHVDDIINVVSKYLKKKKQEAIKQKLKELENDFEPSMWSKFVNFVHKLLRNLWSLLNKPDTWYLIALFPLFGALIIIGYNIFYMIYSFFTNL
jgi:hypothetical protein